MLAETRAELEDFQQSSKELEEELEQELERTEKAQQDLKVKAAKAETERDEWKVRPLLIPRTHSVSQVTNSSNSCLCKPHTTLSQLLYSVN